jgi:hypothetical protein
MDPLTLSLIIGGAGIATNAIRGVGQGRKARQFEADFEAKDKALQPVSAEQYSYLNRVRQMQRSMAMGTDPTSAMAQRGLSQSLAQTQGNIARLGTGSSTVSGLLRAQQGYNMGMGQVAGQAFDQSRAYMQQEQGLIDNIQKSIYGLQMKRRNYAQQKAVAMRQDASDSATAAIAGLGQMATMIPNKVGGGDVDMDWMGKTAQQKSAVMTNQINSSLPSNRDMSYAGNVDWMQKTSPQRSEMLTGQLNDSGRQMSDPSAPSWWTGQAPTWWSQK